MLLIQKQTIPQRKNSTIKHCYLRVVYCQNLKSLDAVYKQINMNLKISPDIAFAPCKYVLKFEVAPMIHKKPDHNST